MVEDAEWLRLDAPFTENDLHGPLHGPAWLIEEGRRPLLFTAVHGVVHHRPGMGPKSAEARTGGLARVLAACTGASTAFVLRSEEGPDANFDPHHPLKQALLERQLIGPGMTVIDLHGMTNQHPVDIAIGRGPDPALARSLAELAVVAFEEHGFAVDPYGARSGLYGSGPGTITTFAQAKGAAALQIEISRRNRTFSSGPEHRRRLLESFCCLADSLKFGSAGPGEEPFPNPCRQAGQPVDKGLVTLQNPESDEGFLSGEGGI